MGNTKMSSEQKCKIREYHVQKNKDIQHRYVKIYYNKNQLH